MRSTGIATVVGLCETILVLASLSSTAGASPRVQAGVSSEVTLRGHLRRISQQAPTYEPDVTETVVSAIIVENYSEIVETNGGHLTGVSIGSEAMQTTAGDSKQQRRLTTNCTRDSPLTVYAPKLPTVAGCYPKIAVGENGTGIYDSSMRENASRVEYVIGAEGIENGTSSNVYWVLARVDRLNGITTRVICVSEDLAYAGHPSDAFWKCDFSERGDFAAISRLDFGVLCGPAPGSSCKLAAKKAPSIQYPGYKRRSSSILEDFHLWFLFLVCAMRYLAIATATRPSAEQQLPRAYARAVSRTNVLSSRAAHDEGDEEAASVELRPLVRPDLPEATTSIAATASRVDRNAV